MAEPGLKGGPLVLEGQHRLGNRGNRPFPTGANARSCSSDTFSFTEHAIGASDVAASFDLQVNPEGQEVEVQPVGLEEPKEEVECPNHEPASFVKGKPRSILSLPLLSKVYLIYYIY